MTDYKIEYSTDEDFVTKGTVTQGAVHEIQVVSTSSTENAVSGTFTLSLKAMKPLQLPLMHLKIVQETRITLHQFSLSTVSIYTYADSTFTEDRAKAAATTTTTTTRRRRN